MIFARKEAKIDKKDSLASFYGLGGFMLEWF